MGDPPLNPYTHTHAGEALKVTCTLNKTVYLTGK